VSFCDFGLIDWRIVILKSVNPKSVNAFTSFPKSVASSSRRGPANPVSEEARRVRVVVYEPRVMPVRDVVEARAQSQLIA
jgi:hypothetical protein